jgi:hypothetical protein
MGTPGSTYNSALPVWSHTTTKKQKQKITESLELNCFYICIQRRESEPTPEEYDEFFRLVDRLLWDEGEESSRAYRRGRLKETSYRTKSFKKPGKKLEIFLRYGE